MDEQALRQLDLNCKWLISQIDQIHQALCPGQLVTWQQRAENDGGMTDLRVFVMQDCFGGVLPPVPGLMVAAELGTDAGSIGN